MSNSKDFKVKNGIQPTVYHEAVGTVVSSIENTGPVGVFSTDLYEGNGSQNLTVTNGIDLAGEGGMVWYRRRDAAENNSIEDTERGLDNVIYTDSSNAEADPGLYGLQAFNSDGFTAGYDTSGGDYVSWTFRKAPKCCTCWTYTGDGTAGRTISHNLGSTPGCIIIKGTSSNYEWPVYHRGVDSTAPEDYYLWLNYASARTDNVGYWNDTAPTSTQFTLGNNGNVNASGQTYVAYLFAHDTASDGIIQCGSYTGNNTTGNSITLGWEPQWLLIKNATTGGTTDDGWWIVDKVRGLTDLASTGDKTLQANTTAAEDTYSRIGTTSTGFELTSGGEFNQSGDTYIYMAIRNPYIPTITYDTDLEFAGGTAPTSPAIGETDVITVSTRDGGTTYQAVQAIDGAK